MTNPFREWFEQSPPEVESVKVWVKSRWGERREGTASLSPHREKKTVGVSFDPPLIVGFPTMGFKVHNAEFNLEDGKRVSWGQGTWDLLDDWTMLEEYCKEILEGGGG